MYFKFIYKSKIFEFKLEIESSFKFLTEIKNN